MRPEAAAHLSGLASHGVTVGPLLDAAFYVDLGARAVETVERMKRWGAWPSMEYTTCGDYSGQPVLRSLNLLSGLKVQSKCSKVLL